MKRIPRTIVAIGVAAACVVSGNPALATPLTVPGLPAPALPAELPTELPSATAPTDTQQAPTTPDPRWTTITPGGMGDFPLKPTRDANAGQVVSSEDVELMATNALWQSTAKRFDYSSTDSMGRASVDRALYIEPTAPWRGDGPRPLVAIAPGTQGTGTYCDPSQSTVAGPTFHTNPPDIVVPYETIPIAVHLSQGAAVVIIDHHRNPETGAQEYVDNISSGQSLLDAAEATQDFGVDPAAPIATYGYSQGGSASGAAAQMAGYYAPHLNIAVNAVGGPPSDLMDVLDTVEGGMLAGVLGFAIDGLLSKDPELRDHIYESEMSETGREVVTKNNSGCMGNAILTTGFRSTSELTKSGETLKQIIEKYPPIVEEIKRQKLGHTAPTAPTLVWGGIGDDVIPIGQIRRLRDDWIAAGGDIHYFENEVPPIPGNLGIGHALPMLAHIDYIAQFIWSELDPHGSRFANVVPPEINASALTNRAS
ncbi:lipase family protein [Corynebacterium sp. H113]|uniref:lipase family protein n=1 Tax=Corynebacterium sp. H113 TaxID=3133419 RepID=UPI00309E6D97